MRPGLRIIAGIGLRQIRRQPIDLHTAYSVRLNCMPLTRSLEIVNRVRNDVGVATTVRAALDTWSLILP